MESNKPHSVYGLKELWNEGPGLMYLSRWGVARQLSGQALESFRTAPITSMLSIITVSVALFMFATSLLIVHHVSLAVDRSQSKIGLSIFLKDSVTESERSALMNELRKTDSVEEVLYVSKEKALARFKESLADRADLLRGLEKSNPLPASIDVRFKMSTSSNASASVTTVGVEEYDRMVARFNDSSFVELVQYNKNLLGQLRGYSRMIRWVGFFSIFVMLLVTGFIVTNTIRLALYSRKDELGIMRLVGATKYYVQAPCMIEGFLHGFLGAGLGLLMLYFLVGILRSMNNKIVLLKSFVPEVVFLDPISVLSVLLAGACVGVLGSYIAVRRFSVA